MINVYLINMDKDVERLAHMRAQIACQNLDFIRVPAVNGYEIPDHEFLEYGSNARGRKWGTGALGCFLSHYQAWKNIVANDDEYGLVLEDDIYFSDDFGEFIRDLSWVPADADIVRLETSTNRLKLKRTSCVLGRVLYKVESTSWCAGAYIIRKRTAKKLLAAPQEQWDSTDYFLFSHETSDISKELIVYQISPAIAVQAKFNDNFLEDHFQSNIETHRNPYKKSANLYIGKRILRLLSKVFYSSKRVEFKK